MRTLLAIGGGIVGWLISGRANGALAVFFRGFNRAFEVVTHLYGLIVARLVRIAAAGLVVYAALMLLTWLGFRTVPIGFIPEQDKGYLVVLAQLPDGASLERTEAVMARVAEISAEVPGVAHTFSVPGFSLLTGANQSNAATMFLPLQPFEERVGKHSDRRRRMSRRRASTCRDRGGRGFCLRLHRRSKAWATPVVSSYRSKTAARWV